MRVWCLFLVDDWIGLGFVLIVYFVAVVVVSALFVLVWCVGGVGFRL